MIRIAVGPEWSSIPQEQQRTLTDEFSRMTIATYTSDGDEHQASICLSA